MADKNFKVKNGITIPQPLAITDGGTGQTSASNAINALLPVQTSAANKFLQSDGTNVSWVANTAYSRGDSNSRPGSPTAGDLYYNTDYNYFESYTGSGWFPIAAAPGAPTSVVATNTPSGRAYNNGRMSVAFSTDTSAGAPSSFIVTPTPTTSPSTFTGSSSPIIVTGLASSTQYTYTVQATSPYGTSSASSASSAVTATTVPQSPTINSVVSSNGDSAVITFTAGATGGSSITGYTITSYPSTTTQTTSSSPYTFTGLTLGQSYTFTMTATNANGTSASTTSSSVEIINPDPGAMFAIATVNVGSSGATFVEFTNIPQTYKNLQIRATLRGAAADTAGQSWIRVNGVTTEDYVWHGMYGTGGAAPATENSIYSAKDAIYSAFRHPSGNSAAGLFGAGICDILEYSSTNKLKTVRTLSGYDANGSGQTRLYTGYLGSTTNAITSIRIQDQSGGGYAPNTKFVLYGIKA